jgi:hypothetical protein
LCFSPEADLAVGVAVVAIGVDALRHVRAPRQIPLASVPLVLGLHQITETFVWWGLQDRVAHSLEQAAIWTYLVVAFVVVPVLVTVSAGLVERRRARQVVIALCAGLVAVVAIELGLTIVRGNISATIETHHLAYQIDAMGHGGLLTELYIVATCGALLASSYRDLEILGVLNVVAVPVLSWLTVNGFVSLWCFWAAIVSVMIAFHMRRVAATPHASTAASADAGSM